MLPAAIASGISNVVVPCLPFLMEKVSEGAMLKVGEDVISLAQNLWQRLWPKAKGKAELAMAANKLAADPSSAIWQPVFKEALEELLASDPALAQALEKMLESSAQQSPTIRQTVIGNQNQVIGSVSGGTVIYSSQSTKADA